MKKFKSLVLCTLLIAAMLLTVAPAAMAAEPTGYETLVWENDFDDVEGTPSGSEGTAKEIAAIDYRINNADYQILEGTDGNKYLKFTPNTNGQGNVGNNMTGYFAADAAASEYPIKQAKIEFSIMLDSLQKTTVNAVYSSGVNPILTFQTNGKYSFNNDDAVGDYKANEWMKFTLYIDYVQKKAEVYIEKNGTNQLVGTCKWSVDTLPYLQQIRFRTNPNDNGGTKTSVNIDDLKYYTNKSADYVARKDLTSGYTSVIADFNFDDLAENTIITRDGSNAHDATKTYYVQTDGTVTVKKFNDEYKNVLLLEKGTNMAAAGVARVHSQKYPSYVQVNKYPSLIKTEVEIYKNDTAAAYIYVGGTDDTKHQLMLWSNSTGFKFRYKDGTTTAQDTTNIFEEIDEWHKVTFYIDFAGGKYIVYLDGVYVKTYELPVDVTNAELFYVRTNGSAYIDNMSVTTIPAYEAPVISEFTNNVGENKLAFVGTNTETTAKAYKILCAKYNSDNTFEDVTISTGEIAASAKLELEELTYPTMETDGSYYRYFIWNDMTSIVPLVGSITID